jgi:predicted Rossmann fold nucleotide-binding protein DprA/Smf involved in DNA uptake
MTPSLSANTQSILLLTAPLIAGSAASSENLLTPGEYKRLARYLRQIQRQPADLISSGSSDILHECQGVIDESRLQRLLGRGFLLSQVVERWQARAIWVISRADPEYPRQLKTRLRDDAPAVLYGCGDIRLLESGGLAIVGSRHVEDSLIDYTVAVGQLAARARRAVVSGGAKGIDQAAMRGALEAGGKVKGILADSLEKTTMIRENRNLLLGGDLVLASPYDPSAGFNVGNAMQRNKLIYALADASLVVSSDLNKGGTWAGAIEQLDKHKFVPVYVRSTGEPSHGLDALRKKGALPWPNPQDLDAFQAVFEAMPPESMGTGQTGFSLVLSNKPSDVGVGNESPAVVSPDLQEQSSTPAPRETSVLRDDARAYAANKSETTNSRPADELFAVVREAIPRLLREPMKDSEVAAALDVTGAQAKAWLQRLVDEGFLEKKKAPTRYVVKQRRLFE